MPLSDVFYLAADVTWKPRPFGSLLFRVSRPQKVFLNATATQLVAQLDGVCTAADIATTQAARYGISCEQTRADVTRVLDRLAAGNWLTTDVTRGKPVDLDQTTPPLDFVSLALTHRCNLRCRHCYIPLTDHADAELTTDEWLAVIRQLQPFKLMGAILTGGEPLLRSDFWQLVEALKAINVEVILATNGTLIDAEFVEHAQNAKVAAIQIGMDGAHPASHEALRGADTFERTWRGIDLAHQAGLPVELLCTITRSTVDEYMSVVRLARQRGLQVALNEFLPLGPARANRAELELTIQQLFQLRSKVATLTYAGVFPQKADEAATFKYVTDGNGHQPQNWPKVQSCLGRDSGAHVLPNGDVLICPLLNWPHLIGGNVRYSALRDIWEHSPVFQSLRELTVDGYATCRSCTNRYLCGGTCRALALAETHDLAGSPNTARCFWEKIFFARMGRAMFDSTEPFQTMLERENLLR